MIQRESDAFKWGEGRDEHHFVRDLLHKAYRINVLTDQKILLHNLNGSTMLIDPQLAEPERSSHKNWSITQVDCWIPSIEWGHGIYLDGPIHDKDRVQHNDKEVNRWYEQARETHSRIKSELVIEAMTARTNISLSKQLELASLLMKDIMEARFRRFKLSLPTHYNDRRLTQ